jgi:ABC-type glycerol-3-phosphate transport system substrate-binding protein
MQAAAAIGALACLVLSGCGGGASDSPATSGGPSASGGGDVAAEAPAGELKVLTHRTDLDQDGTLQGYADQFMAKYPEVTKVEFESITAYDDDVPLRLSTGDFGDVLSIPNGVTNDQLAQFFEPIGSKADLSAKYRFLDSFAVGEQVYGLAQGGIATGVVYNKKVFADAGVTTAPTSYDDFLAALEAVKANTDAVPLYTNYKDGWPLGDLQRNMGVAKGNANAKNDMTGDDAPWAEGGDAYWLDSLLYDAVDRGLTEADPTTTNWEESKTLLGSGQVATLVLQSWAISQMQTAAVDAGASADDIGFLPVPSAVAGKSYAAVLGDRYYAVNAKSANKVTAKAWVEFMIEESGYDAKEGFVSTLKSAPLPSNLSALSDLGTELFEPTAAPAGEEGLFDAIDTAAEIGFSSAPYRQALVDKARQHTAKADAFGELNAKWAAGRAAAG